MLCVYLDFVVFLFVEVFGLLVNVYFIGEIWEIFEGGNLGFECDGEMFWGMSKVLLFLLDGIGWDEVVRGGKNKLVIEEKNEVFWGYWDLVFNYS